LLGAGNIHGQAPWFAYAILTYYFVFFNLFSINMYLLIIKKSANGRIIYTERVYVILSLLAKSILAWLVFASFFQSV